MRRVWAIVKRVFQSAVARWQSARVADRPLGKYILLVVCMLHFTWAIMLIASPATANSTPIHLISEISGGRYRAAAVLIAATLPSAFYPFVSRIGKWELPLMLIPQQTLLILSAAAGIHAAIVGHYADGVQRGAAFIIGDQAAICTLALLYTIAVLEAAWSDRRIIA